MSCCVLIGIVSGDRQKVIQWVFQAVPVLLESYRDKAVDLFQRLLLAKEFRMLLWPFATRELSSEKVKHFIKELETAACDSSVPNSIQEN